MKPEERQLNLVAYLIHYRFGRTLEEICRDLPVFGTGAAARKKLQRDRGQLAALGLHIRVVAREGEAEDGNLRYLYQLDRRQVFAKPLRLGSGERQLLAGLCTALAREPDFRFRELAASARQKLLADLDEAIPHHDDGDAPPEAQETPADPWLPELLSAMKDGLKIDVRYRSIGSEAARWRTLHPFRLTLAGGAWMLIAWCELRQALRWFRPGRIEELKALDQHVDDTLAAGLLADEKNLEVTGRAWRAGLGTGAGQVARISFDPELAAIAGRELEDLAVCTREADGGLLATCRVQDMSQFGRWLLAWGRRAKLAGPPELKQDLANWLQGLIDQQRSAEAAG